MASRSIGLSSLGTTTQVGNTSAPATATIFTGTAGIGAYGPYPGYVGGFGGVQTQIPGGFRPQRLPGTVILNDRISSSRAPTSSTITRSVGTRSVGATICPTEIVAPTIGATICPTEIGATICPTSMTSGGSLYRPDLIPFGDYFEDAGGVSSGSLSKFSTAGIYGSTTAATFTRSAGVGAYGPFSGYVGGFGGVQTVGVSDVIAPGSSTITVAAPATSTITGSLGIGAYGSYPGYVGGFGGVQTVGLSGVVAPGSSTITVAAPATSTITGSLGIGAYGSYPGYVGGFGGVPTVGLSEYAAPAGDEPAPILL